MPRFTHKIFIDLAVWMIGLGVIIGAVFPFFISALQIENYLTLLFWSATLGAGIAVGAVNFWIAQRVVKPRLQILAYHMQIVESTLRNATYSGDWSKCNAEKCHVTVDSDDDLGKSAQAFNELVDALFRAHDVDVAVRDFSRALSSQLDLDALCKQGLDLLVQHAGAAAGVVLIEESGDLTALARYGLKHPDKIGDNDYVRRAMRTRECQHIELPEDIHIDAILTEFTPREILVIPIDFKEVPLGVVILASTQTFSNEKAHLLQLFRQGFGLALNNALVHDRLQRMAAIDVLTGAYNRRFGFMRLREEFNRSLRGSSPLGILIMDLDHFKSVNDSYGHLVGDRVLSKVTEICGRALREGDFIVRYGGEEFVVALPGASQADSVEIAENIRRLIAETVVKDGLQHINFSASFGATSFPEDNVDGLEELIKHADDALFQAKEQGRNQVVAFRYFQMLKNH
jgi:two-component system, cell cycle response regulator